MAKHLSPVLVLALLLGVGLAWADAETGKIVISVIDKKLSKPVACRIHLYDRAGKPVQPPGLPFFRDHFVCNGSVTLELAPGEYTYEIERGPEYTIRTDKFTVAGKAAQEAKFELERLI